MNMVELHAWQLALAAALLAFSALVSVLLRLGLERSLFWAAVRTAVQLLAVGFILRWLFARANLLVLAAMLLMTFVAGAAAAGRCRVRYRGIFFDSLVSVWVGAWLITALGLVAVVRPEPWYAPQYWIPILGMMLHNTLTGISLGLDRLGGELLARRSQVETLLCLGATRWEAAHGTVQEAVRTGMIPTINTMMVVGIVSLPGMMTGQLIAGVDAVQAVMYQIVIMFLIAAATSVGTAGAVLMAYRRMFTANHQFRPEQLGTRSG